MTPPPLPVGPACWTDVAVETVAPACQRPLRRHVELQQEGGEGGDNQSEGLESRPLEHLYPLLAVGCQTKWGESPKFWFYHSH